MTRRSTKEATDPLMEELDAEMAAISAQLKVQTQATFCHVPKVGRVVCLTAIHPVREAEDTYGIGRECDAI